MYTYFFEKLDVWKNSLELCKLMYRLSAKFPDEEKFGMISQLRRSVISVSNNLVEGSSRTTGKSKARFTNIAYGSLVESLNLIIIAKEFDWISFEEYKSCREKIDMISYQLINLKKAQSKMK